MPGLSCVTQGQGPWLVLLHAFPFDGRMWQPAMVPLSQHFRLLVPDLRGFGRSRSLGPAKSIDQMADDVAELMREQGVPKAAVLGLSMGGYVALGLLRRHPELLSHLILCDTRAEGDDTQAKAGRARQLAVLHGNGVGALLDSMMARLVSDNAGEAVRERLRHEALDQTVAAVSGAVVAMRDRPDATGVLQTCPVQVLGVVGSLDTLSPPDEMRTMTEQSPLEGFVEIPGVGHLSCSEAPDVFATTVSRWLQSAR